MRERGRGTDLTIIALRKDGEDVLNGGDEDIQPDDLVHNGQEDTHGREETNQRRLLLLPTAERLNKAKEIEDPSAAGVEEGAERNYA